MGEEKAKVERDVLERELGKAVHEIGKQQKIFNAEAAKLKKLQDAANALDDEIEKLDG